MNVETPYSKMHYKKGITIENPWRLFGASVFDDLSTKRFANISKNEMLVWRPIHS